MGKSIAMTMDNTMSWRNYSTIESSLIQIWNSIS